MLILYIATGAFLIGGGVLLSSGLVQQTSRSREFIKKISTKILNVISHPSFYHPHPQPHTENLP